MPLSDIIQVTISVSKPVLSAAGFGTPMILGSTNHWSDRFRVYTSLAGMVADGYLISDPEYLAAAELLEQPLQPTQFVVGRRLAAVAQQDTITFNSDTSGHVYTATVNGVACSFTSVGGGTSADATGLAAAIHAQAGTTGVDAAAVGPVVTLTALTAGTPFTCVLSGTGLSEMALVAPSVANQGIAEDLAQIRTAGAQWYGTLLTSRVKSDAELAAAWTESNNVPPTILFPQTSESASGTNTPNPASSDLANFLFGKGYLRTALMYHTLDAEYADAAWVGGRLPVKPGTENWALKQLVGITPDSLSQTVLNNLQGSDVGLGKNANVYYQMAPTAPITSRGTVASGQWIDVVRFVDFLTNAIQVAVGNLFLTTEKVEFSDFGIQQVAAQVTGVLQAAKDARALVSYSVSAPASASISPSDKAARRLNPPITFTAQLSGALNSAKVVGTVTQ